MASDRNSSNPTESATMTTSDGVAARRHPCGLMAICMVVAIVALATFIPALNNDFVYDDSPIILNNPLVNIHHPHLSPMPWYRAWLEPYWPRWLSSDKLYRPLSTLSLRANALLAGDPIQARPFRMVNLALHALTSVGVVIIAWRLTSSRIAGMLAGMLFATHPVHAEAVVTIYGRGELLAGCLAAWLLAIHLKPPVNGRRRIYQIVPSNLLFLAAVAGKEHAIFLWPCLILIDLWHRRDSRSPQASVREWFNTTLAPAHIGFALATTIFLFLRYLVFGWQTRMNLEQTRIFEVPMAHVGTVEQILTPFRLLWVIVVNLAWPDSLCPIWSYPALMPADRAYADVLAGMVLAGGLVVLAIVLWYRRKLAGALVAGMMLTLAIPVHAISVACWFYAERWLYLPTVFIFVLLSRALLGLGKTAGIVGLATAIILMPQSWRYSAAFTDNISMMHETIVRQPDNFQGHRCYAIALYRAGRYGEAIQAANQLTERFAERFGEVADAYLVLYKSHLEQGDGRQALQAIEKYEYLRRDFPVPGPDEDRQKAMQLIARQQTTTAPATRP